MALAPALLTNLLVPVPVASTTALVLPELSPARLAVMTPLSVRLPAAGVPAPAPTCALRLLTEAAPSVRSLVSTSCTAAALAALTAVKSLLLLVSVKLPPPLRFRFLPAEL